MWGRLKVFDKKKEDEEKKASRAPEEYGLGVLSQRIVEKRLAELDKITWEKDARVDQNGAIASFASMMRITMGLARIAGDAGAIEGLGWLYARWQGALEAGEEVKPLQEALEFSARSLFIKYSSMSILPEDLAKDIAVILYQGKPGQNMEGQKLLE